MRVERRLRIVVRSPVPCQLRAVARAVADCAQSHWKIIDAACGHSHVGGLRAAVCPVILVGQGVAGDGDGLSDEGGDEGGADGFLLSEAMTFGKVLPRTIKELDFALGINPAREPAAGMGIDFRGNRGGEQRPFHAVDFVIGWEAIAFPAR